MITVISATNRPQSNTAKVARRAVERLRDVGATVDILDLAELPAELFDGASYAEKPTAFEPFQDAILAAHGVVTVVPEYNGSFPGVMKYFIDMLRFPESLYEKPAAFIGLSAGPWGAVRGVEQLEMVFQYRHAHLFGRRVFIPDVSRAIDDRGRFTDEVLGRRFDETLAGFVEFCRQLRA
ncbi:MAG: NAD(P)H-dependent oxidoreductase [Holophagae bacterium]|jgi:NAD(P)H-dependent FMN reductase